MDTSNTLVIGISSSSPTRRLSTPGRSSFCSSHRFSWESPLSFETSIGLNKVWKEQSQKSRTLVAQSAARHIVGKKNWDKNLYLSFADVIYLYEQLKDEGGRVPFENLCMTLGLYRYQPQVVAYLYNLLHRVNREKSTDGHLKGQLTFSDNDFFQFMDIYTEPQKTLFGRVIVSLNCWCALFGIIAAALNVFSQFVWNKFYFNLVFIGNLFWVLGALAVCQMAITPIQLNQVCDSIILHQFLKRADEGRLHENPFWAARTLIKSSDEHKLF